MGGGLDRRVAVKQTDPSGRAETARDRDRILYCDAFRRLEGVTQVSTPSVSPQVSNRLTHSLRVEQIGGALAGFLNAKGGQAQLDVDAVRAGCLAHDIGHPPFGHAGEEELNALVTCEEHRKRARPYDERSAKPCTECLLEDGFEGNAQSFRVLSRLEIHRDSLSYGLNLTERTLAAASKYPWRRGDNPNKPGKWGAYDDDFEMLAWAAAPPTPSLEASAMDWSDDITYAVHDVEDYYRVGLIPLNEYAEATPTREGFWDYVREVARLEVSAATREAVNDNLFAGFPKADYHGTSKLLMELDGMRTKLITYFLNEVKIDAGVVAPSTAVRASNDILKQLVWFHVIDDPDLAAMQLGQRRMLRRVFKTLCKTLLHDELWLEGWKSVETDKNWSNERRLPLRLHRYLEAAWLRRETPSVTTVYRAVLDYIASLTDAEIYNLDAALAGRVLDGPRAVHPYRS